MTHNSSEEPRIPIHWHVPGVGAIQAEQAGSTWPEIPWRSESSWNGWVQRQLGLEYAPAVSSSGPAKYARYEWRDLPQRHKDDFYLVGAATFNGIKLHSTFSTPDVLQGFRRAVKAVLKVSL
jgi:hypothetical protein